MSRIGKKPIIIPANVTVNVSGKLVEVVGPRGTQKLNCHPVVGIKSDSKSVNVVVDDENYGNIHGLTRSLIANMVTGVTEGWKKTLELNGTGYRASVDGTGLHLSLGFSHPVIVKAPEGVGFEVKDNKISVSGSDKGQVGEIAAKIRSLKPVDPYKQKGFRYEGEVVIKKAGKAAKVGA
jgi:large subunit ribosomal protein L6